MNGIHSPTIRAFSSSYLASPLVQLLESLVSCCANISRTENICASNYRLMITSASSPNYIFDRSCLNSVFIYSSCSFLILRPTFFNRLRIYFLKSFRLGSSPRNHGCFFTPSRLMRVFGLGSSSVSIKSRSYHSYF